MLTDFYPPIIGGMEIHVQNLSTELAARGHSVAVATLWHKGLAEFELDRQVRVHRIRGTVQRMKKLFSDQSRRFAPPFPDPEIIWRLRNIIQRERPDIVHAHNWLVYSFIPLRRWSGAKLVYTLHDYSLVCVKKDYMYQGAPCSGPNLRKCLFCSINHFGFLRGLITVITKRLMTISDHAAIDMFLPVSQAVAEGNKLVGNGLPYRVIPNFLTDDFYESRSIADTHLAELPAGDYLLFVGDLLRDKGIEILLRAYTGLSNPPPLVLLGRKTSETPEEFPQNVHYLGSWPHEAIIEAWRRCSIALVPSIWPEPFGIVAIEAMASGKPLIASRIGGLPDLVVDNETGFLVTPGDPVALRLALQRLLMDGDLRERMGRAGKNKVIQFQARTVVPLIEQIYQKLIYDFNNR
jgi:glycosyltransferase involved in cell wall biosynthesis